MRWQRFQMLFLFGISAAVLLVQTAPAQSQDSETAMLEEAALQPYSPPPVPGAEAWPDARLKEFMRDMTDYVYENMAVKDPERMVYGMIYEFYQDDKQMQVFSLDAMHDGAWFVNSMFVAERIDPRYDYFERAREYQMPFYMNMLINSDKLFPNKKRRVNQENKPIEEPLKGWVPRGWDDGEGWDRVTKTQFKEMKFPHVPDSTIEMKNGEFWHAYYTPSNHLSQDLADLMLNYYMSSKDTRAVKANDYLYGFKDEYFGLIPVLAYSKGFMHDDPDLMKHIQPPPKLDVTRARMLYQGMYLQKPQGGTSHYSDGGSWTYRAYSGDAVKHHKMDPVAAWTSALEAYDGLVGMDMFFDVRPYHYGLNLLHRNIPMEDGTGKLRTYSSNSRMHYGSRGIQLVYIGSAVLPTIRRYPDVWEQPYYQDHAEEPLIRIIDNPPVTDGKRDDVYDQSQTVDAEDVQVTMISDPKNLHILVQSMRPMVRIHIEHAVSADQMAGPKGVGVIEISKSGEIEVANAGGEKLLHKAAFSNGPLWTAEIRIPYTIQRAQKHWINGVDHGRYNVKINNAEPVVVYMLSRPQRIIKRLEDLTLGTVQTWYNIWHELGFIPEGYHSPGQESTSVEYAESGGHAHLIHVIAYLLMDRADMAEWQLILAQMPEDPMPSPRLPDSVLKAQGIK